MFNLFQSIKSYFIIILLFFNTRVIPSNHQTEPKNQSNQTSKRFHLTHSGDITEYSDDPTRYDGHHEQFRLNHPPTSLRRNANSNRFEHDDYTDIGSDNDYLDDYSEYQERSQEMQKRVTIHHFDERDTSLLRQKRQTRQTLSANKDQKKLEELREKIKLIRKKNAARELRAQDLQSIIESK